MNFARLAEPYGFARGPTGDRAPMRVKPLLGDLDDEALGRAARMPMQPNPAVVARPIRVAEVSFVPSPEVEGDRSVVIAPWLPRTDSTKDRESERVNAFAVDGDIEAARDHLAARRMRACSKRKSRGSDQCRCHPHRRFQVLRHRPRSISRRGGVSRWERRRQGGKGRRSRRGVPLRRDSRAIPRSSYRVPNLPGGLHLQTGQSSVDYPLFRLSIRRWDPRRRQGEGLRVKRDPRTPPYGSL